jgi:hypothetical protein
MNEEKIYKPQANLWEELEAYEEKDSPLTTIEHVVDQIMTGGENADFGDFMDDKAIIEAFGEIMHRITHFEPERGLSRAENQWEKITQIEEFLEQTVTYYVTRGGKYV